MKTLAVLLVEDSPLDGRLLMEALRASITAGEVVLQAVRSLGAAKGELQKGSFDCVLLDLGLPDGRGTGNVSALREVDKNAAIVVLTGLDDDRSATESLKLGAQDYLIKGETDGDALMKLIRRAVQRNRQTVALEVRRDSTFFDASRDPLTLLPNRSLLLDRMRTQLAVARQGKGAFGLGVLVVTGLDEARARYGAGVADEALQRLVQVMGEGLKASDTLARLEGGEFALLLLPFGSVEAVAAKARQLKTQIEAIPLIGNCPVDFTLRYGTAMRAADETADELLDEARAACDRVPRDAAVTDPTGNAASASEDGDTDADRETPIPDVATVPDVAVTGLRLVPRWQPWADLAAGRWLGVEFVPQLADGTALFADPALSMTEAFELGLAAADAFAAQWRLWRGEGFAPSLLSLNVPAAALRHERFVASLRQVLDGYGMPAAQVQIEVGESAFKDGGSYLDALTALHGAGYVLCMEGDGSADIGLREFVRAPVTSYKLSRHFLATLVEEGMQGPARRFLTAMQGASQALGSSIVASGVDSPEARAVLQLVGIGLLQGDSVSPALPPDAVPPAWQQRPQST